MASIVGSVSGAVQDVDATFKSARASLRPMECLNWYSVGAKTGALTTVAASGAIFSFRNIGVNPIVIRRVGVGFVATTAFTAAQVVDYGLIVARAFTASDTGGTAIALTGNNAKVRTSLATVSSIDCRIATTAALTGGTKALDTNYLSMVGAWITGVGAGVVPSLNNLLSHDPGDYPLVLGQNEGFNIQNLTLMGAVGVGQAYVNFEFAEATAF